MGLLMRAMDDYRKSFLFAFEPKATRQTSGLLETAVVAFNSCRRRQTVDQAAGVCRYQRWKLSATLRYTARQALMTTQPAQFVPGKCSAKRK